MQKGIFWSYSKGVKNERFEKLKLQQKFGLD